MRLIDADELAEELSKRVWYEREDEKQAVRIVKESSTVDAVPVVRCKECKWHEDEKTSVVWCPRVGAWVYNDWYCKGGDRKGGSE